MFLIHLFSLSDWQTWCTAVLRDAKTVSQNPHWFVRQKEEASGRTPCARRRCAVRRCAVEKQHPHSRPSTISSQRKSPSVDADEICAPRGKKWPQGVSVAQRSSSSSVRTAPAGGICIDQSAVRSTFGSHVSKPSCSGAKCQSRRGWWSKIAAFTESPEACSIVRASSVRRWAIGGACSVSRPCPSSGGKASSPIGPNKAVVA